MSEWDDLIRDLTREHPVRVATDDGDTYTTVEGLLDQLRDEVFGGTNRAGVSGNKTKLPMNAPALDLYTLIDRQVAEVWGAAFNRIPNADRTETLLTAWAAYSGPDALVTYSSPATVRYDDPRYGPNAEHAIWLKNEASAINLLRRWKRQIDELFDPPRTAEINAACIQCNVRKVVREVDGQSIPQPALVFIRDRETGDTTEARCQACGTSWLPSQFLFLAEQIGANEKSGSQLTHAVAESVNDG